MLKHTITIPFQVSSCNECPNIVYPGTKGGRYPIYCKAILKDLLGMEYKDIILHERTISSQASDIDIKEGDINMFNYPGDLGGSNVNGQRIENEGATQYRENLTKINPRCPFIENI